jgi:hypothetical protein
MTPLPFAGETMTCVVCNKQARNHPTVESNWRSLTIDNQRFYACPAEFPPDHSGQDAFSIAYQFVIACCLNESVKRASGQPVAEIERLRRLRRRGQTITYTP